MGPRRTNQQPAKVSRSGRGSPGGVLLVDGLSHSLSLFLSAQLAVAAASCMHLLHGWAIRPGQAPDSGGLCGVRGRPPPAPLLFFFLPPPAAPPS